MNIRPERVADYRSIARIVEDAFGQPDEARLVERIRASDYYEPELTLVAEVKGAIVGHVMYSGILLRGDDAERRVLALGPVAVTPARQRSGIGGALIRAGMERADARGDALIVLLGHPAYYPRFGFEPARARGVLPPTPKFPDDAFMVKRLSSYDDSYRGNVVYPPAWEIG